MHPDLNKPWLWATELQRKQMNDVRYVLLDYTTKGYAKVQNYKVHPDMHRDKIIPYDYICRRVTTLSSMNTDVVPRMYAIHRSITFLIQLGEICEAPSHFLVEKYNDRGRAYYVLDYSKILALPPRGWKYIA